MFLTVLMRPNLAALAAALAGALPASGQTTSEDLKIVASDGAAGDQFGFSIAIDDGIIVLGSPFDRDRGLSSGSAYPFDVFGGMPFAKLLQLDGLGFDEFGYSVAIDDGIVAVGARQDDDRGIDGGSAYLFDVRSGEQLFKLLPTDNTAFRWFGWSIDIDDGVVAVGAIRDDDNGSASGAAYLFDASTGAQLFKLVPDDGVVNGYFGSSIALSRGVVAVGASGDDDLGGNSGSVYLFDSTTGVLMFKLVPSDGDAGDQFGFSIGIDLGVVAVGSPGDDENGNNSGSAYLFDACTGAMLTKLLACGGASGDQFGRSIAIGGGAVAIGAWGSDESGSNAGSAYLFDAATGSQRATLVPSDGGADDRFGNAVAIGSGRVAVAASMDDDAGVDSGSVYLFSIGDSCPGDLNGDGMLDASDLLAFLSAFSAHNQIADLVDDNLFNFFDLQAFLNAFSAGCP